MCQYDWTKVMNNDEFRHANFDENVGQTPCYTDRPNNVLLKHAP